MSVRCPSCESETLDPLPIEAGESGYICPLSANFAKGQGCNVIVSVDDFNDLRAEQQAAKQKKQPANASSSSAPTAKSPPIPSSGADDEDVSMADDSTESADSKAEEEAEGPLSPVLSQAKAKNVTALLKGSVRVKRCAMLPMMTVKGDENPLDAKYRRTFKPPRQTGPGVPIQREGPIGRRLGVRMKFFNGKFGSNALIIGNIIEEELPVPESKTEVKVEPPKPEPVLKLDPDYKPLVLWEPTPEDVAEAKAAGIELTPIIVEPLVGRFLREHQREGVQFCVECVLSQRNFDGSGAILADDMGLGKTLQSITVLFTLLRQGFEKGKPIVNRAIVCCPTSLVANWRNEIQKWTGENRVKVVALSEANKDKVTAGIKEYLNPANRVQVLIISYETFRMHAKKFHKDPTSCDLLICDEAHRLKNDKILTYEALNNLACKRRILLSGTPMQNDLSEFYAMVNFTNPGVLGDKRIFGKQYERPILAGREPDATPLEQKLGTERSNQLSAIVNQFILRRTNVLLSKHLPPKVVQVVCCSMTDLQMNLYKHFVKSKAVKSLIRSSEEGAGKPATQILPLISALKSLCNHPKLVWDIRNNSKAVGFQDVESLFPPGFDQNGADPKYSGKFNVLDRLLRTLKATTDDRVVLVSNFTQTLDLMVTMCKMRNWQFVRLDGSTSVKKRQKLVDQLTDRSRGNDVFIFLLSSKAGGCGLNLIGANRLVLFDPDWNPAVDKQAAARIWRDGQQKRCYVYRFLTTGTIEEKVYQRQLSKEGLTDVIGGQATANTVSTEDLRDLFNFQEHTISDTHDSLSCDCSDEQVVGEDGQAVEKAPHDPRKPRLMQRGFPKEENLAKWAHHTDVRTIPDPSFRKSHGTQPYRDDRPKHSSASSSSSALGLAASSSAAGAGAKANHLAAGRGSLAARKRAMAAASSASSSSASSGFKSPSMPSSAPASAPSAANSPVKTPASAASANGAAPSPLDWEDEIPENNVTFVFSCEVQGRPITSWEEEIAKQTSAIDTTYVPDGDEDDDEDPAAAGDGEDMGAGDDDDDDEEGEGKEKKDAKEGEQPPANADGAAPDAAALAAEDSDSDMSSEDEGAKKKKGKKRGPPKMSKEEKRAAEAAALARKKPWLQEIARRNEEKARAEAGETAMDETESAAEAPTANGAPTVNGSAPAANGPAAAAASPALPRATSPLPPSSLSSLPRLNGPPSGLPQRSGLGGLRRPGGQPVARPAGAAGASPAPRPAAAPASRTIDLSDSPPARPARGGPKRNHAPKSKAAPKAKGKAKPKRKGRLVDDDSDEDEEMDLGDDEPEPEDEQDEQDELDEPTGNAAAAAAAPVAAPTVEDSSMGDIESSQPSAPVAKPSPAPLQPLMNGHANASAASKAAKPSLKEPGEDSDDDVEILDAKIATKPQPPAQQAAARAPAARSATPSSNSNSSSSSTNSRSPPPDDSLIGRKRSRTPNPRYAEAMQAMSDEDRAAIQALQAEDEADQAPRKRARRKSTGSSSRKGTPPNSGGNGKENLRPAAAAGSAGASMDDSDDFE